MCESIFPFDKVYKQIHMDLIFLEDLLLPHCSQAWLYDQISNFHVSYAKSIFHYTFLDDILLFFFQDINIILCSYTFFNQLSRGYKIYLEIFRSENKFTSSVTNPTDTKKIMFQSIYKQHILGFPFAITQLYHSFSFDFHWSIISKRYISLFTFT